MGGKKILVTSALPYANGSLHLGHMVEYVQTDIFVRFLRSSGKDVVYACADDTHGTPIEIAAKKAGVNPEELIARYRDERKKDFGDFHVSFDVYHTTHSKENKEYSDFFFNTLKEKGHIYRKVVEQTYCERDGRFLPDRFVKGECPKCRAADQYGDQCEKCGSTHTPTELENPRCSMCGSAPVKRDSEHYFFRLRDFSERIEKWITENRSIQKDARNFVMRWIENGLEDWDVTRDGPYFGFKIPGEENKYYYVWLDAPIGYVSASEKYARDKLGKDASIYWKSGDAEIVHFIGKDIIYFHFLFWPAMLMGVGYNLPSDIPVHGHLTVNSEKMSKSRGNFFTVRQYLEKCDAEALRFYYASNLSKNAADINLDFDDFKSRINNDFVNNICNFVYRTLSFINKHFDSEIGVLSEESAEKLSELRQVNEEVVAAYNSLNFRSAVKGILKISDFGNKIMQDNEPWKLVKEDREKCGGVLAVSANVVKTLALLLEPIVPVTGMKIKKQLGVEGEDIGNLDDFISEKKIGNAEMLMTAVEEVPEVVSAFPASLRIAEVESVENHPDADKLYVLQIKMGGETRQIVSGLRDFYSREDLVDRKIVVVANLKPAKLRGQVSRGMLLTAEHGSKVVLLEADGDSGDHVLPEGMASGEGEISIDAFHSLDLKVKEGKAFFQDRQLRTGSGSVRADVPDNSRIT